VYKDTSFFEGVQQQKKSPNKPGNAFPNAILSSRFQKFAAGAAKTNRAACGFSQSIH